MRVQLSTLLPWALNPQGVRAGRGCPYECGNKVRGLVKLSKIKTSMSRRVYLNLAHDTRRQPGKTQDLWLGQQRPLKKRELMRLHTNARGYTRATEASISIYVYILALALSRVLSARVYSPRLLQRVRLAHFGRCNCYQLLSDITGMPDISLPFILLYDYNNFIWIFRFFKCIIIWIILKKYAASRNSMTGTIPECKSRCGQSENFEVFLNSPKFSKTFLKVSEVPITQYLPKFYPKSFEMFFEIFWYISQDFMKYLSKSSAITLEMFRTFFWKFFK